MKLWLEVLRTSMRCSPIAIVNAYVLQIFYVVWLTFESFFIYFYLLETKDVRSILHLISS